MKKNTIAIFSFLLLTLFSCQKVLDVKETDFIGGDVALLTVANNESAIIGAYAGLNTEQGILLAATLSDEVRPGDFYNAATTHEWQYGSSDVGLRDNFTATSPQYTMADRVNRVLAALPTATSTPATAPTDPALKLRLRGEALFLRAFAHFELYRFYSNSAVGTDLAMPYMDAVNPTPTTTQKRITVAEYFVKLKADLAEAKTLVPDNLTDIARATKLAVSGLQARVSLYLKEYANASTFATEYINGIPLAPRASFAGIWTDANKLEQAFQLPRSATQGARLGSLWRGTGPTTAIGSISWTPSDKLWNSYNQATDIRFASYLKDEPLLLTQSRASTRLIAKYAGTGYGTTNENVANVKVFRTGEMYLIRAEAKAENADLTGAAADLNALRAARISGYVDQAFATKDALITAIMDERFKELPYEGHRFFDLKRRNLPVSRSTVDAPNTASQTLPAGNFRFIMPIPLPEMQANPAMVQNPGYGN